MFTVTVLGTDLTWNGRRFEGDESLVRIAQGLVAEGFSMPITPTGPRVRCQTRPELNAWATALAVVARFNEPAPSNLPPAAVAAIATPDDVLA